MTDTWWVVGAAVLGALAGGGATVDGSYWVGRYERRHKMWATLYVDLLPELLNTNLAARPIVGKKRPQPDVMDDIRRTAILGGSRCSRHAEELYRTFKALHPEIQSNAQGGSLVGPSVVDRLLRRNPQPPPSSSSIQEAVVVLDEWLVHRLT